MFRGFGLVRVWRILWWFRVWGLGAVYLFLGGYEPQHGGRSLLSIANVLCKGPHLQANLRSCKLNPKICISTGP